jgi:hypothetical protein
MIPIIINLKQLSFSPQIYSQHYTTVHRYGFSKSLTYVAVIFCSFGLISPRSQAPGFSKVSTPLYRTSANRRNGLCNAVIFSKPMQPSRNIAVIYSICFNSLEIRQSDYQNHRTSAATFN